MLTLMGPAVIAASAVQVNVLVNSGFAASLGNGPVSWLNIAFRLMQLPLGIFGVAIGTVTLPLVSKSAAVGNTARVSRDSRARNAAGVFAHDSRRRSDWRCWLSPIISVIYQHGRFTAEMTRQTAGALQYYAIGLVAYAALKVLTPAFYAIGKRNTPMVVSFLAIGANLFLNWLVHIPAGVGTPRPRVFDWPRCDDQFSLALRADATAHAPARNAPDAGRRWRKICVAGALLALICWAANHWWLNAW